MSRKIEFKFDERSRITTEEAERRGLAPFFSLPQNPPGDPLMPRTTPREMYSVTEETQQQVADLAKRWGGVGALPKSQVIREAIRRCWLAEQDKHENGKKK